VGADYQADLGTPREWANAVAGDWLVEPVWMLSGAGQPTQSELDTVLVSVSLASGRVHPLQYRLDTSVSADWCPETSVAAALRVELSNRDGSFWAANSDAEHSAYYGPGPRGRRGEETVIALTLPVQRFPGRWADLPEALYNGESPVGFRASAVVPTTEMDVLSIQTEHEIDDAGGRVSTGVAFSGLIGSWEALQ